MPPLRIPISGSPPSAVTPFRVLVCVAFSFSLENLIFSHVHGVLHLPFSSLMAGRQHRP